MEDLAGQPLDAGGRGPLADADGDHARREQQHVAALDVLVVPAVDLAGAGEARVLGVDQLGQLGLALAGRHRQRGDRDPVADPHAGVAGEQQVGQRVDEEVVAGRAGEVTRPKPPRTSSLRMPAVRYAGQLARATASRSSRSR